MSQSVFGSVQVSLGKCPRTLQNDKALTHIFDSGIHSRCFSGNFMRCIFISRVSVWCAHLSILMIGRGEASHCPLYSQDEPKQLHRQPTENQCCAISCKKVNGGLIYEERTRKRFTNIKHP